MPTPTLKDAQVTAPASPTLGILDVLGLYGFDRSVAARLVRHQNSRYPIDVLRRNSWLELYQRYQGRPVFHGLHTIVSFYGLSGTRAAFCGVYHVGQHRPARLGTVLEDCPWSQEWSREAQVFYDLERDGRFDHLRDRLVIDWGAGTRSWVQKLSNKAVLAIEETGRGLPVFDDYLSFSLSFAELRSLFASPEAHRDWRSALSAVAGIYLILAEPSGDLYVGSAYGADGIWGRWREYARTGHGHNALLKELVSGEGPYPDSFRFSVLQVLPQTMSREAVIRREQLYKEKLGARATGLNLN